MVTNNNKNKILYLEPEEVITNRKSFRILVVDDEEIIRSLFRDVLEDKGYQVVLAPNGEEAIERLKETPFDLVITDIRMPGIDGMEVLRRSKAKYPEIDIIIITGYASVETAVEAMKLGAADYLTKPLNIDQIRIIVDKTLQRRELQKRAQEAEYYKELSKLDSLTGLFNHSVIHQLLEAEVARAGRYKYNLSLLMIDIDHFKHYNDTYGHPVGDQILKEFVDLLKKSCRSYDLVGRYGGEEFCIIAPQTDKKEAALLGERLVETVGKANLLGNGSLPLINITISIGIATYPIDALDKTTLLIKADQALYQAKSLGRNRVGVSGQE
jgi:diguanylate cyclase (GGDEF)-like protein